jgi:type II secretory pathway pseudopilin PulG
MLAIMMLALTAAAPKIAKSIQRDREVETMHRGKQYARAVKLYYKKFGRYPPNVDALVKTNEIRFLRKKYLDPMTGKDDWKPIQLGQNKTQTLGFFGQPIAGSGAFGLGATGGNGLNGGSTLGNNGVGGLGSSGALGTTGTTDNSQNGGTDTDSGNGSTTNGPDQTNGAPGQTSGTSSQTFGGQGQTFGGAGIMGFKPGSPKQSILVYKKKNHYNEWEFFYDPIADQMMTQGGLPPGTGGQTNGAPGFSQPGGTTGTTTGTGGGITPTPTPAPTPQNQQ